MKNSLRTKIALVSLVFVSSIAYAKKNNNKAVFTAGGTTATAMAGTAAAVPAAGATGTYTAIKAPARVSGNLFVDGRLYGKFYPKGTEVLRDTTAAQAPIAGNGIPAEDLESVVAFGAPVVNATTGKFETTHDVSTPLLVDDLVSRSFTAADISVGGQLMVGEKRYVGSFSNFDPAVNMIILTFADNTAAGKPARINWSFATTTTWGGATTFRNESVAVFATNGGIPDIISPLRPGRSFVSTDMKYTNTVYMWTSKAEGINLGNPGKFTVPASKALFNTNLPSSAASYTINGATVDLTLTSSVRNIFTNGARTALATDGGAYKMAWGLTSGITNFHTATRITGVDEADGRAAVYSAYSPFSNHNGNSTAAAGTALTTANGVLHYEIIGSNVTDVTLGYTWDKTTTITSSLSGLTSAQLTALLNAVIAALANLRGAQPVPALPASREAMIRLLEKHSKFLEQSGILKSVMNQ